MKKILSVILIATFLFSLLGCGQKTQMPEGMKNKKFYNDMVSIVKKTEKGLTDKKLSEVENSFKIIDKYMKKGATAENYDLKTIMKDDLNDKEKEVLEAAITLVSGQDSYLRSYFKSTEKYDKDKLIDEKQLFGDDVIEAFSEFVDLLEIEYKINK